MTEQDTVTLPGAIFECPSQGMKSRFSAAHFPNQKVGIPAVFALEKRCWNKHVHFTADYIGLVAKHILCTLVELTD